MKDDEKLVTIVKFESSFNAELAKLELDNAGIQSVVLGDNLPVNLPEIDVIRIELQVFEKDAERAKQILAEKYPLDEGQNDEGDE